MKHVEAYREQMEELLTDIWRKLDCLTDHISDIVFETARGQFTLALDNVALYVIHATQELKMVINNIDLYGIAPREDADEE